MNHHQLVVRLSRRTGLTQLIVKDVLDALGEQATENFRQGDDLFFPGVGKLVVVEQPARTARNMWTGEPVPVAPRRAVKFRMSQRTKEMLS